MSSTSHSIQIHIVTPPPGKESLAPEHTILCCLSQAAPSRSLSLHLQLTKESLHQSTKLSVVFRGPLSPNPYHYTTHPPFVIAAIRIFEERDHVSKYSSLVSQQAAQSIIKHPSKLNVNPTQSSMSPIEVRSKFHIIQSTPLMCISTWRGDGCIATCWEKT